MRGQEVPKRAESVNLTSVAHPAKLLAPLKASRVKLRVACHMPTTWKATPDGNAGGCRVHPARLIPAWPVYTPSESFKPEDEGRGPGPLLPSGGIVDCFSSMLERVGIPGLGAQMVPKKGHPGVCGPGGLDLHYPAGGRRQDTGEGQLTSSSLLTLRWAEIPGLVLIQRDPERFTAEHMNLLTGSCVPRGSAGSRGRHGNASLAFSSLFLHTNALELHLLMKC